MHFYCGGIWIGTQGALPISCHRLWQKIKWRLPDIDGRPSHKHASTIAAALFISACYTASQRSSVSCKSKSLRMHSEVSCAML